jgi:hypothetical protein
LTFLEFYVIIYIENEKGAINNMNEFYRVNIYWGQRHYFHDKDSAFEFLWQMCLNSYGDNSDEFLNEMKQQLNESYRISGLGEIEVCGFED